MGKFFSFCFVTLLLTLLLAGFIHPVTAMNQDLGRHIKTGEIILATHTIPGTNLYSYTYPSFPFINHHWLSEVVFFLLYQISGITGLFVLLILTVTISCVLLFSIAFKRYGVFIPTLIATIYLRILFERTDIRPEIFSFLFLSLFITILYRNREKATRLIYLLPVIELLWTNMHIYFFVGIVVIFLFFLDACIVHQKNLKNNSLKKLCIVLAFCLLATLCNPHGITGALYPFTVFNNYGYQIEENQNIFFLETLTSKATIPFFKLSVVLLFLSLLVAGKKSRPIDWFLSLTFTILGTIAIRNFPLFIFTTFLPLVHNLSTIFRYLQATHKNTQFFQLLSKKLVVGIALLFFLSSQIIAVSQTHPVQFEEVSGARLATDFFLQQKLKGPIYNNFDIGSYLDFRLYPRELVFVDGRPEAYPASFFTNVYIPSQEDIKIFSKIDSVYHFNTIFFSHTDQTPWAQTFLRFITHDKNWKIIYLDESIIILVKDIPANKLIIDRFGMDEKTVRISHFPTSWDGMLWLTNFFQLVRWRDEEQMMYQKLLEINPTFCPALKNLDEIYYQTNNPAATIMSIKIQTYCQ